LGLRLTLPESEEELNAKERNEGRACPAICQRVQPSG
jgi:hypothetical protein